MINLHIKDGVFKTKKNKYNNHLDDSQSLKNVHTHPKNKKQEENL